MAWEHLSINKPHLVYIILGGFTSLFMLCSSIIKERLYIGEATVATVCGIIFGPHAANLINPLDWGNTDQITLEFARIVLVVQCFAVGVELPRAYMERHWQSVTCLLVPVMTFGWLMTSLFIWWMVPTLDWLDALCCAACVTATDPVLASSVVGKGKFAKRVPKHLRDLLSAESGCNDGMAFPFIYLALYLLKFRPDADLVSFHWFCYTILYECIFGTVYGVSVGYIARRLIRYSHEHDCIDRESFLVFYFVLALFCAGSGSILGLDDLLVGFATGVGFSNDGWFLEKTEESHVSNVIDLLLNLAFFVYFGTIIPWEQYNAQSMGLTPWRLVVIAILVLFFRRIPIMLACKPIIPDLKTWREALFAGHFGPIGVGAIFVAILARAELETDDAGNPLENLPLPPFEHLNVITVIWPITTFLVITSIVVHGSSIAVFTLGKHINTLTLTLSYTQANEEGPSWMERLPRIQSRSKSSMSLRRPDETDSSMDEKAEIQPGTLGPIGIPGQFLRRQKEEESSSRASSVRPSRRRKWDSGRGPGGPISQSAIMPQPRNKENIEVSDSSPIEISISPADAESPSSSDTAEKPPQQMQRRPMRSQSPQELYQEGDHLIVEDEEGNVLAVLDSRRGSEENSVREADGKRAEPVGGKGGENAEGPDNGEERDKITEGLKDAAHAGHTRWADWRRRMESFSMKRHEPEPEHKTTTRGPALAYQFGNTIIVEDESGEVIKKYDIPSAPKQPRTERKTSIFDPSKAGQHLQNLGNYLGLHHDHAGGDGEAEAGPSSQKAQEEQKRRLQEEEDDARVRFTVGAGGRRMSKAEFIQQVSRMDPKLRADLVQETAAPDAVKREAVGKGSGAIRQITSNSQDHAPEEGRVPFHPISDELARFTMGRDTAAERRRRGASRHEEDDDESPAGQPRTRPRAATKSKMDEGETEIERKRREGALGIGGDQDDNSSSEEDEEGMRVLPKDRERAQQQQRKVEASKTPRIQFAQQQRPQEEEQESGGGGGSGGRRSKLKWGTEVGKKTKK
ncbi:alkali metal cation/H+ antiporter Nha1 C terminus-domain-containing protein [Lineolata rhizophorae]|uniref:Alkali metal cation/H+ antiporter Nha1 C terminus-domain-containing protein n=1 Tax=Lineolata rhizophorae TaxID=578093 RepID=A0A6A6NPM4_9PEZI|nr:alkali metal cation/H+ antiporter Nha1 C terminus-domain-containing protein [Lineolata rhizophorae]